MTKAKIKHNPINERDLIAVYTERVASAIARQQEVATRETMESQVVMRKAFFGFGNRLIEHSLFDLVQFNLWLIDGLIGVMETDEATGEPNDCGDAECRKLRRGAMLMAVGTVCAKLITDGTRLNDGLTDSAVTH